MYNKYLFSILFLLLINVPSLAFCGEAKIKVAVSDLAARRVSGMEASIISDYFRDCLFNTSEFDLVDRDTMERKLTENNIQSAGCNSNECALKMGNILKVRLMISGNLTKIEDVYYINIKIFDIEKSTMTKSETVSAGSLQDLHPACAELADKIVLIKKLLNRSSQEINVSTVPLTAAALVSDIGKLEIRSSYGRVEVYVNGDFKGFTPVEINLKPGGYKAKLVKEDKFWEGSVYINPGQITSINPPLKIAPGDLEVNSDPEGAQVYLDNMPIGTTPLSHSLIESNYEIKIYKDGYDIYKEKVSITPNRKSKINVSLNKTLLKPEMPTRFGIGFHYPGISLRLVTGIITVEAKMSSQDKLSIAGGRLCANLTPRSSVVFYTGVEADTISGETEIQKVNGSVLGAFIGMEIFATTKISVLFDIGPYSINMKNKEFSDVSVDENYIVGNVGVNVYF